MKLFENEDGVTLSKKQASEIEIRKQNEFSPVRNWNSH